MSSVGWRPFMTLSSIVLLSISCSLSKCSLVSADRDCDLHEIFRVRMKRAGRCLKAWSPFTWPKQVLYMHLDAVVIVEDGKSSSLGACGMPVTVWQNGLQGHPRFVLGFVFFSLLPRSTLRRKRATAHPEREFICSYHDRIYSRSQPEIGFLASDVFPHSSLFWFMKTLRQRAILSTWSDISDFGKDEVEDLVSADIIHCGLEPSLRSYYIFSDPFVSSSTSMAVGSHIMTYVWHPLFPLFPSPPPKKNAWDSSTLRGCNSPLSATSKCFHPPCLLRQCCHRRPSYQSI